MTKPKKNTSVSPFEALVKRVYGRIPRGLEPEWVRLILGALSDLSFDEYAQRRYTEDSVGDVLVFEGERRKHLYALQPENFDKAKKDGKK